MDVLVAFVLAAVGSALIYVGARIMLLLTTLVRPKAEPIFTGLRLVAVWSVCGAAIIAGVALVYQAVHIVS
jgi:hypothetical protein